MSLEKNIANHEKALGRTLTEARHVAGVGQDADRSPAYEDFPAGNRDAPSGRKPDTFGHAPVPVGNFNESRNGVNEIVNGTDSRNRSSAPATPSGESEAVTRNAARHAEALRRAAERNK